MENNSLSHHGVKNQRWGIRRFQRKDGSLTALGKRRLQKERAANLEKARQAKEAKRQHEAEKQKAIKTGSVEDVLKFKGELTKQEMDAVVSRIQWEQNLRNLEPKVVTDGKTKTDKAFDKIGDITDKAITAAKAYNMVANIANAFGNHDVVLPTISTDVTKSNRNQRKKEQEDAETRKAEKDAEKAARKAEKAAEKEKQALAEEMRKYEEYNKSYTDPKPRASEVSSPGEYRQSGGSREVVNPNGAKPLALPASTQQYLSLPAPSSDANVSRGRDAVSNVIDAVSWELID